MKGQNKGKRGGALLVDEGVIDHDFYDKSYFNLVLPGPVWNNQTQKYTKLPNTSIQQTFEKAIIDIPEDYYLAVVRLSVPTGNIPLHIMEPLVVGGLPLIYVVTLEYNGVSSSVNLVWNPTTHTDPTNEFYYAAYRYGEIVSCINKAFTEAFNNINPPVGAKPPFMYFNPDKQRFVMNAQAAYYSVDDNGNTAPPAVDAIKIYVNGPLQVFFDGMSQILRGYNFQILMRDWNGMNWMNPTNTFPAAAPEYLFNEQQWVSLALINSVKSVQIISNSLPIKKEYVPQFTENGITGNISSVGILKDFIPIFEAGENMRTYLNFVNDGPYQLINMYGRTAITNIDISIRWTDKNGKAYPIEIPYDQTISIRFGFFKKKSFTG